MRILHPVIINAIFAIALLLPGYASNARLFFYQANENLISGNFVQAITLYQQAIDKKPDYTDAYLGLGIAYKEVGDYPNALDSTNKVLELNPKYYQAYYNLALILEKQGLNQEAINSFEIFLEKVPGADRFTDVNQRILRLRKLLNENNENNQINEILDINDIKEFKIN